MISFSYDLLSLDSSKFSALITKLRILNIQNGQSLKVCWIIFVSLECLECDKTPQIVIKNRIQRQSREEEKKQHIYSIVIKIVVDIGPLTSYTIWNNQRSYNGKQYRRHDGNDSKCNNKKRLGFWITLLLWLMLSSWRKNVLLWHFNFLLGFSLNNLQLNTFFHVWNLIQKLKCLFIIRTEPMG